LTVRRARGYPSTINLDTDAAGKAAMICDPHRRAYAWFAALSVVLGSSGCGAFIARTKVVGATTAVAAAGRTDAEKSSPYEYVSSLLYLEKAREAEAYGRFGAAIEYGALAEQFADRARVNASTAEPETPPPPPAEL
jgi:hypothetical protein